MELGADLGIAHDGDADRTLAVDHTGQLVDGDHMIAILAVAMKRRGELAGDAVAVTRDEQSWASTAAREHGIAIHDTKVGDRYVLEEIHKSSLSLGGEQSGHIILARHQTTGDGILTGLHLAAEVIHSGRRLHDLASDMEVYPQVLVNVPGVNHDGLGGNSVIRDRVADIERALGDSGRVLLRASGTEPLVRVMVEAATKELAHQYAAQVADVVRQELAH